MKEMGKKPAKLAAAAGKSAKTDSGELQMSERLWSPLSSRMLEVQQCTQS